MAKTALSTDNALTKNAWDERLFRDQVKASFFSKFMSSTGDSIIHKKTDLEKDRGDKITFGIRMRLSKGGVVDNETLEGKEESLTTYDYSISLHQYRHGVRDNGALSRKRAMYSVSDEARTALQDWGTEKIDQLCFDAITASPTKIIYSSDVATSVATLATTDLITPEKISKAKVIALTQRDSGKVPLRPIMINGKKHLVLLLHPYQMFDLRNDATVQQMLREASWRGSDNPLFSGADLVLDNVIIYEHENVPILRTGGAGTVPYCKSILMGAQALVWAFGKRPETVEADFDYGNEKGIAWGMIAAVGKPKFNSQDYGSVGFYSACTDLAS